MIAVREGRPPASRFLRSFHAHSRCCVSERIAKKMPLRAGRSRRIISQTGSLAALGAQYDLLGSLTK